MGSLSDRANVYLRREGDTRDIIRGVDLSMSLFLSLSFSEDIEKRAFEDSEKTAIYKLEREPHQKITLVP